MAVQYCNYDIKGTLAVAGTATFAGRVNINSGNELRLYRSDNGTYARFNYAGGSVGLDIDDLNGDGINLQQAGVNKLRIETTGNATFAGSLDVNGTESDIAIVGGSMDFKDANDYIRITKSSASAQLGLFRAGSNAGGMYIGAAADGFRLFNSGFAQKLIVDQNGNATFAGDLTVSGGDITLGGTGRIQGIDTVSASTDATNKAYVDNAVAGAGSGTFLPLAGGTMSGNIAMGDNDITGIDQLTFQEGSYFDDVGSSNYIRLKYNSTAGGGLRVEDNQGHIGGYLYSDGNTTSSFGLLDGSASWAVRCVEDEYVELRYDNVAKFQTTSSGVQVTGGAVVAGAMSSFETTLSGNDDWENSPISILERGNVQGTETADKYAPNLNFHWGGLVSNSLWMGTNGNLNYGSYSAVGIPAVDGTFAAGNLIAASAITGNTGAFTGQVTGPTPSTTTSFANKAYVDAHDGGAGVYLPLAGGRITGTAKIEFNNAAQYIHALSVNDLSIVAGDDINYQSNYSRFFSGGTEHARLTGVGTNSWVSNGSASHNFGVGTNSPTAKLHVVGTGLFTGNIVANSGASGQITISPDNIQSNQHLILGSAGGANIEMYTNGTAFYDAISHSFRDSDASPTYFSITASQVNSFVKLSMASQKIIDLATPTLSTDAANKSYVDAQIATIPSGLNFQGNWNASTNSPTLTSGSGTPGFYYNVSVAGSTNLDGETDWQVGDWAVFVEAGATDKWEKIDNTSALTGVGANNQVSLWGGTNTLEGSTALTFTGGDLYVTGDGNSNNWYSAYQDTITAFSDSGSSTITLTLTQRDGGTLTTSFSNPQGTVTGTGTNDALPMWNSAGTGIEDSPFAMGNVDQSISNTDLIIKSRIGHHGNLKTAFGFINTDQFIIQLNNVPYFNMTTSNLRITDLPVRIGNTTGIQLYSSNSANLVTLSEENGNFAISTIPNATSDTDKFLVSDSGEVKYRTGAQVLSDIGGAPATGGNYLPLAGGTMTGDIQMSANSVKFDQSGTRSWDISPGGGNLNITSGDSGGLVYLSPGISVEDNAFIGGYATITGAVTGGDGAFTNLTINAGEKLRFDGPGGHTYISEESDSNLKFYVGGTEQLNITNGGLHFNASLTIPDYINHAGDSGTKFGFSADDTFVVRTGGSARLTVNDTAATFTGNITFGDSHFIGDDSDDNLLIQSSANENVIINSPDDDVLLRTAGTTRLTIANSISTFSNNVKFNGAEVTFNPDADSSLRVLNAGTNAIAIFAAVGDTLYLGGNNTTGMYLDASANATFLGDITVDGGDITLGGTGRIQGVDTVSAGTDAANKDYVDTAVAGSGSGTVTSVSSATTSQLTVSQSSPAPELSIVTAAVTNGGTALATGDQIYDATSARLTSYLNLAGGTMVGATLHGDSVMSRYGTGNDFSIYHAGTAAYLENTSGDMYIMQRADNADISFQCDNGAGGDTEYLRIDGQYEQLYLRKDMQVADGKKLMFGDSVQQSGDLEIYHDGSNSYINETGTGSLVLKTGALLVRNPSDASMLDAQSGGAINLYYNGSKKFETTSVGVTVTGDIDLNSSAMIDWANGDARIIEGEVGGYSLSFEIYNGASATERVLLLEKDKKATFAGDIVLGASSSIVLDDTPTASTASGSGTIVNWSVSTSVTAGTLYVVKTDGGWTTADADSEAKSTAMAAIALGSNATAGMLLQGFFYKAGHGFALGSPLYISNTAGAFSNSRPTGTGDYVRIIGYATSANYIYFDPDKTWVKID